MCQSNFCLENNWKNSIFLSPYFDQFPRIGRAWLRNYIAVNYIYFGCGTLWSLLLYGILRKKMPSAYAILEQVRVSSFAMPFYSLLPALAEYAVEREWTLAYSNISDIGVFWYITNMFVYMSFVEFAVYWIHRVLHWEPAYRLLHAPHHIYNKEHTLTPFAGLAFHPLDGILQALPYIIGLFIIPVHFLTYELLLFATGIWTCNIHDCIHGRCEPIMGAGYHTIHHTDYRSNFGHYFIYMDWLFGTLRKPKT